jgi:hypothetical protein
MKTVELTIRMDVSDKEYKDMVKLTVKAMKSKPLSFWDVYKALPRKLFGTDFREDNDIKTHYTDRGFPLREYLGSTLTLNMKG